MCQQTFAWPHGFQRTPLGKCKTCRGWRRDVPAWLSLQEIFSAEMPVILRRTAATVPLTIFERLRTRGERDPKTGGPASMRDFFVMRDDVDTLLDRARVALQRGKL